MADQVEVPKLTQEVATGPEPTHATVSKLVMFLLLQPGDGGGGEVNTNRQGHIFTQIVRR